MWFIQFLMIWSLFKYIFLYLFQTTHTMTYLAKNQVYFFVPCKTGCHGDKWNMSFFSWSCSKNIQVGFALRDGLLNKRRKKSSTPPIKHERNKFYVFFFIFLCRSCLRTDRISNVFSKIVEIAFMKKPSAKINWKEGQNRNGCETTDKQKVQLFRICLTK